MRLYAATSQQFIQDTVQNQIAEKLKLAFFEAFRFNPSPGEVNSWRNSLRVVAHLFEYADLTDHGVILEYQLPLTSNRLDCLVSGRDREGQDSAVILELKQWDQTEDADGDNEVTTWVGGAKREVLHPSVQVGQYHSYLQDAHTAFYEGSHPIRLSSCAYLHNYSFAAQDPIRSEKFSQVLRTFPLFSADDVDPLRDFLQPRLQNGHGNEVLQRIEQSKYRPSKKLMDHVAKVIKGVKEYVLLDEQLVVYDKVFASAKKGFHDKKKTVIIIKGGPGTGKSVIAINLMADLMRQGYNAHYATGSKAFTETLRKVIGPRGAVQFNYFSTYAHKETNSIDVLLADESHRMWETAFNRFQPQKASNLPLIQEILDASKVAVFFVDDDQVVRPKEVGTSSYIREHAQAKNCTVFEYELEAQFRCSGSDAFVNWVNNTLQVKRTANVLWNSTEGFDFRVFSDPQALEDAIRAKSAAGFSARMTAGFCWPWSAPKPDGTLVADVVVGDYRRPWNAKPTATRLAHDIPKSNLWAYEANGIHQVGCIYTAQGFEFDYVGVIFGEDLLYDFDHQTWTADMKASYDTVVKRSGNQFLDLVKRVYRVLMSRGLKGCYVYFLDKDTEKFFRSRMEPARNP